MENPFEYKSKCNWKYRMRTVIVVYSSNFRFSDNSGRRLVYRRGIGTDQGHHPYALYGFRVKKLKSTIL